MRPIDFNDDRAVKPIGAPRFHALSAALARAMSRKGLRLTELRLTELRFKANAFRRQVVRILLERKRCYLHWPEEAAFLADAPMDMCL